MGAWRKNARHEPIIVDLEALRPKGHLPQIMDYELPMKRI